MTSPVSNSPQLTPENFRELEAAHRALRKVRRAVSTARFEGFTVAICGGVTALSGIPNIGIMLVGVVLTAIGVIEIIGGGQLRRLDLRAVRVLTINQLCLATLILLYALWNLHAARDGPSPGPNQRLRRPSFWARWMPSAFDFTHEMMLILYGSLIAAAVLEAFMGLYSTRAAPSAAVSRADSAMDHLHAESRHLHLIPVPRTVTMISNHPKCFRLPITSSNSSTLTATHRLSPSRFFAVMVLWKR